MTRFVLIICHYLLDVKKRIIYMQYFTLFFLHYVNNLKCNWKPIPSQQILFRIVFDKYKYTVLATLIYILNFFYKKYVYFNHYKNNSMFSSLKLCSTSLVLRRNWTNNKLCWLWGGESSYSSAIKTLRKQSTRMPGNIE